MPELFLKVGLLVLRLCPGNCLRLAISSIFFCLCVASVWSGGSADAQTYETENVENGNIRLIDSVISDHDSDSNVAASKGIRKTGAGVLALGSVNTFTGPLKIEAGKVLVLASGGLSSKVEVLLSTKAAIAGCSDSVSSQCWSCCLDAGTTFAVDDGESSLEIAGVSDLQEEESTSSVQLEATSRLVLPENRVLRLLLDGTKVFSGSIEGETTSNVELAGDPNQTGTWHLKGSSHLFKGKVNVRPGKELRVEAQKDTDTVLAHESIVELDSRGDLSGRGHIGKVISSGIISPGIGADRDGALYLHSLTLNEGSELNFDLSDQSRSHVPRLNIANALTLGFHTVEVYITNLPQIAGYSGPYTLIKYGNSNVADEEMRSRFSIKHRSIPLRSSLFVTTDSPDSNAKLIRVRLERIFSFWSGENELNGLSGASGTWKSNGSNTWSDRHNNTHKGDYNPEAAVLTFGAFNRGEEDSNNRPASITLEGEGLNFRKLKFEDYYVLNGDPLTLNGADDDDELSGIEVVAGKTVGINVILQGDTSTKGLVKTGTGILMLGGVNTFTGPLKIQEGEVSLMLSGRLEESVQVALAADAVLSGYGRIGTLVSLGIIFPGFGNISTGTTDGISTETGNLDRVPNDYPTDSLTFNSLTLKAGSKLRLNFQDRSTSHVVRLDVDGGLNLQASFVEVEIPNLPARPDNMPASSFEYPVSYPVIKYTSSNVEDDSIHRRFRLGSYDSSAPSLEGIFSLGQSSTKKLVLVTLQVRKFSYWSGENKLRGLQGASGTWSLKDSYVWTDRSFEENGGDYNPEALVVTFGKINRLAGEMADEAASIQLVEDYDGMSELPFKTLHFKDNYELNPDADNPAYLVLNGEITEADPLDFEFSVIKVDDEKKVTINAVLREPDATSTDTKVSRGLIKTGTGSLELGAVNTFTDYLKIKKGRLVVMGNGDLDDDMKVILANDTIFEIKGSPGSQDLEIYSVEGDALSHLVLQDGRNLKLSFDGTKVFSGSIREGQESVVELVATHGRVGTWRLKRDSSESSSTNLAPFKGTIKVGTRKTLWLDAESDSDTILGDSSTIRVEAGGILSGRGRVGHVVSDGLISPGSEEDPKGVMRLSSLTLRSGSRLNFDLVNPESNDDDFLNVQTDLTLGVASDDVIPVRLNLSETHKGTFPLIRYVGRPINTNVFSLSYHGNDLPALVGRVFVVPEVDKGEKSYLLMSVELQVERFPVWRGGHGTWKSSGPPYLWMDMFMEKRGIYNPTVAMFLEFTRGEMESALASGEIKLDNTDSDLAVYCMLFEDNYTLTGDPLVLKGKIRLRAPVHPLSEIVVLQKKTVVINVELKGEGDDNGLRKTGNGYLKLGGINTFKGPLYIANGTVMLMKTGDLADEVRIAISRGTFKLELEASDPEKVLRVHSLEGRTMSKLELPDEGKLKLLLGGSGNFLFEGSIKGGASSVIELAQADKTDASLGTWHVTGNSPEFAGKVNVRARRELVLNGTLGTDSTVEVYSGGVLYGLGRMGHVVSSGAISPGGKQESGSESSGTVLTMESLKLRAKSVLNFDLDTPDSRNNDRLDVEDEVSFVPLPGKDEWVIVNIHNVNEPGTYTLIRYGTASISHEHFRLGSYDFNIGSVSATFEILNDDRSIIVTLESKAYSFWFGENGLDGTQGASGTWKLTGSRSWSDAFKKQNGDYSPEAAELKFETFTRHENELANSVASITLDAEGIRGLPFRSLHFRDNYELTGDALVLQGAGSSLSGIKVSSRKTVTIIDVVLQNPVEKRLGEDVNRGLLKTGEGTLKLARVNTFTDHLKIQAGEVVLLATGDLDSNVEVILASGATFTVNSMSQSDRSSSSGSVAPSSEVYVRSPDEYLEVSGVSGGPSSNLNLLGGSNLRILLRGSKVFSGDIQGGALSVIEITGQDKRHGSWHLKGDISEFTGTINVRRNKTLAVYDENAEEELGRTSTVILDREAILSGSGQIGHVVSAGTVSASGVLTLQSLQLKNESKLRIILYTPDSRDNGLLDVLGPMSIDGDRIDIEIRGLEKIGNYILVKYRGKIDHNKLRIIFVDSPGISASVIPVLSIAEIKRTSLMRTGSNGSGQDHELRLSLVDDPEYESESVDEPEIKPEVRSRPEIPRSGPDVVSSQRPDNRDTATKLQEQIDEAPHVSDVLVNLSRSSMFLLIRPQYDVEDGVQGRDKKLVWGTWFGSWGNRDHSARQNVMHTSNKGGLFSVHLLKKSTGVTLVGGASSSTASTSERLMSAKNYHAGLSSVRDTMNFKGQFAVMSTFSTIHAGNDLISGRSKKLSSSERQAITLNVVGKVSYTFDRKQFSLEPFASLEGISVSDAAYEEREEILEEQGNGSVEVSVYQYKQATLFTAGFVTLGMTGEYKLQKEGNVIVLSTMLSLSHRVANLMPKRQIKLHGDDETFAVSCPDLPHTVMNAELSLHVRTHVKGYSFTFGSGYRGRFDAHGQDHGYIFRLSVGF